MSPVARVRYEQPSVTRFFATFGYAWFTIGLFTGTLVLVLAVRGILDLLHKLGWGQDAQNRLFICVIIAFVVGSFLLARRVVRALYRQTPTTRRVLLVLLGIPALLSGYAWSNPTRFLSKFAGTEGSSVALKGGPTFIFGSYPDEDRIKELKKEGVTTLVSLQSPAVVVEISGIAEERRAAAEQHLKFIEAPMLPWVSDNSDALAQIKELALHGKGTYYVHCGLGRDRVNIAKRVIESVQPQLALRSKEVKEAVGFDRRTEPFERGMPMKITQNEWVVPYLNKDEFYGFILEGSPGHVFLVLDPADTLQRQWIAEARAQMNQYAVPFTFIAYPAANGDTSTKAIVAQVRAQKPPFTVMVAKTTFVVGDPRNPVARALGKSFGVQVTPLPKVVKTTAGETPDLVPAAPGH